jgi:hypothetical protein
MWRSVEVEKLWTESTFRSVFARSLRWRMCAGCHGEEGEVRSTHRSQLRLRTAHKEYLAKGMTITMVSGEV